MLVLMLNTMIQESCSQITALDGCLFIQFCE